MKLGSGSHTYEWIDSWAKLPSGKEFGYTHGVVCDKADNVYIFNTGRDSLCVFDPDGKFIRSWGVEYKSAHGLYYTNEGGTEFLYITDTDPQKIAKHTLDGKQVLEFKIPPRQDLYLGKPYKPTDCCVEPKSGDVYTFDGYGSSYVHCYDKNAKYKFSIGGAGKDPGQLSCPHAGNIDTRHGETELYVADRGNNRIQVFTLDGKHKRFVTDEQDMPCNFAYYKDEIYIPDLKARVTILDKNDKLIAHLGHNPENPKTTGWPNIQDKIKPGTFSSPHQCRVNSQGDIFVVEWISTGRVTKLKRQK